MSENQPEQQRDALNSHLAVSKKTLTWSWVLTGVFIFSLFAACSGMVIGEIGIAVPFVAVSAIAFTVLWIRYVKWKTRADALKRDYVAEWEAIHGAQVLSETAARNYRLATEAAEAMPLAAVYWGVYNTTPDRMIRRDYVAEWEEIHGAPQESTAEEGTVTTAQPVKISKKVAFWSWVLIITDLVALVSARICKALGNTEAFTILITIAVLAFVAICTIFAKTQRGAYRRRQ